MMKWNVTRKQSQPESDTHETFKYVLNQFVRRHWTNIIKLQERLVL